MRATRRIAAGAVNRQFGNRPFNRSIVAALEGIGHVESARQFEDLW